MGNKHFIVKYFVNNFSLKIQISLRKYFFQPFLGYDKLKMLALHVKPPYFMDII